MMSLSPKRLPTIEPTENDGMARAPQDSVLLKNAQSPLLNGLMAGRSAWNLITTQS